MQTNETGSAVAAGVQKKVCVFHRLCVAPAREFEDCDGFTSPLVRECETQLRVMRAFPFACVGARKPNETERQKKKKKMFLSSKKVGGLFVSLQKALNAQRVERKQRVGRHWPARPTDFERCGGKALHSDVDWDGSIFAAGW